MEGFFGFLMQHQQTVESDQSNPSGPNQNKKVVVQNDNVNTCS